MLQALNLENRDGRLDKAEYIILCMLRLRAIDPELVDAINNQFEALDVDKNGFVEYAELLQVSPQGQASACCAFPRMSAIDHVFSLVLAGVLHLVDR
jgi:hypothetical protein